MEPRLNGEDLSQILCRMAPEMSLAVPNWWIDRNFPGPLLQQMHRLEKIARDFHCTLRPGHGVQVFEKQEVPFTG